MQTEAYTKPNRRQSLDISAAIRRGWPGLADSQRHRILELLHQAGSEAFRRNTSFGTLTALTGASSAALLEFVSRGFS